MRLKITSFIIVPDELKDLQTISIFEYEGENPTYGVDADDIGFPHGNTRAEVAVKTAKRLLRANIPPSGKQDGVALSRALMKYRNTPNRDTGFSPSELLLGRKLKDFLPFRKPEDSLWKLTSKEMERHNRLEGARPRS